MSIAFEKTLEDLTSLLDELDVDLVLKMNRYAILEAKFKPRMLQKQSSYLMDGKNGFDAKVFAEAALTSESDFSEYISLPINIDGIKKRVQIVEAKLDAIDKRMRLQRLKH